MESTRLRKRWWLAIATCALVASVAVLSFGGLASAQDENASPADDGEKHALKIGWMTEIDNLNPFIGWTNSVYEVWCNEYLLMTGRSWDGSEPNPDTGVNKTWEVSDDGLEWTFTINEGQAWHDGTPLTAQDAVFTFNYIIENDIGSYMAFLKDVDRAELIDDTTYKVYTKKPMANMLRLWMPCLPEHIWSELSAEEASATFANDPPNIGNGPWQVVEWQKDRFLRLEYNENWYGEKPLIDEIIYVVYKNGDTMVQDLKSGNLDAIYLFPPAQFDALEAEPDITVSEYTFANWDYVGFNCYEGESKGNPVLRDKAFRQALEYAIDRDSLVQVAYSGHAWPGYTFLPPNNWKNPDWSWMPPDGVRRDFSPEQANKALDDAGYVDSDGDGVREDKNGKPIKIRLWGLPEAPETQRATKQIAGWWEDVGIDVVLTVEDEGVYFDKIWNYEGDTFVPDFDAYYWQWDGYQDPAQTLNCWTTDQIEDWNENAWSNAEYDRLNGLQATELDPDKRAEYIYQMQEILYEESPCIVTTHPLKLAAWRTDTYAGWSPASKDGNGATICTQEGPEQYLRLTLATDDMAATDGGTNVGLWVGVGVGAAVVVALIAFFAMRSRRGGPAEEE